MRTRLGSSLVLLALLSVVVAPISSSANPKGIPNANASGYWTEERRNNAIPREFEFEVGAKEGKLVPQAKRGGSTGGTTKSGTSYWPANQQSALVAQITGKVFFTMNGSDYVCSGSLVQDGNLNIAVVVTAAHCVWNNATSGAFATRFTFWPNYDTDFKNRVGWTASALFAPQQFTAQTSFNTTATLNDFAFAVINSSDARVNPSSLPTLGTLSTRSSAYAFGYPQASPFNGLELVYSFGSVSTDSNSGNMTWRIASTLTGGASGGPWYSGYSNANNVGAVASVNSYKYSSDKNSMYGPKFGLSTSQLLEQAKLNTCQTSEVINCVIIP